MHEAKSNPSRLAARAAAGEEVILMRGDTLVARIVPLAPEPPRARRPGRFKGLIHFGDSFFDPLPEDELELWGR